MGSSIKCSRKIITALCVAFFSLLLPPSSANAIPTAEDINSLAETARLTADTFMRESFQLRMQYEFTGQFLTRNDKENLHTLAKKAGNRLQAIAENQRKLKQQIEDYQGDDWDNRYGSTGLWRKSVGNWYITIFSKCEIDFYLALSSKQPQRNEILHKILTEIESTFSHVLSGDVKLLKIKTLILLAETKSDYKTRAKDALNSPDMIYPGMQCRLYIRGQIEKIKFAGKIKPGQLNKLARELAQSSCADDFELVLPLAFLQRRHDTNAFEKIVQLRPETESFLGSLILQNLSCQIKAGKLTEQTLQQITVFEAELAVQKIWNNISEEHQMLLDYLAGTEKFQTPLILYVAAIAFADSSPARAVKLLVKASKLQQQQQNEMLETSAEEIAEQAAKLAYTLLTQNSLNCPAVLEAFENYSTIANEKNDEELEYLYTIVLSNCGQAEKAAELLQKIADRPAGHWRNRAKLDLITTAIQQSQSKNREKRSELLKQLVDLITDCRRNEDDSRLRTEAITVYCRLLLESRDKTSAQKVLDILTDVKIAIDPNLNVFKSNALRHLGRLDESAEYLVKICRTNNYEHVIEAEKLLLRIIDRIEQLQQQTNDFPKLMKNSQIIAQYCERIALSTFGYIPVSQARLYLAEISVFAALKDQEKLLEIEKLLNDLPSNDKNDNVDFTRCRARLLTEQGRFSEAAGLWAQVAKIRKSETVSTNQRSWKWWRAKFYELYCCAKISQIQKEKVLHTIEVLENSFTNIPSLWAEKLSSLKQQCRHSERQKT